MSAITGCHWSYILAAPSVGVSMMAQTGGKQHCTYPQQDVAQSLFCMSAQGVGLMRLAAVHVYCMQVHDEDTVLWMVIFHHKQARRSQKQLVQQLLEPVVRCPFLSSWTLAALIGAQGTTDGLFRDWTPLLAQLSAFLQDRMYPPRRQRGKLLFASDKFKKMVPAMPASWAEGCRKQHQVSAARIMSWSLPVSAVHDAVRQVVQTGKPELLSATPPPAMRAISGGCSWEVAGGAWPGEGGVMVAFCTRVYTPCGKALVNFMQSLTVNGECVGRRHESFFSSRSGDNLSAVLRVDRMNGGWNRPRGRLRVCPVLATLILS